MNSSQWSPYNQQSYLSGGSPHLPPSAPHDPLNNYGGGNSNSLLMPSCHNVQPISSRTNSDLSATSLLPNPNYESLISPREATEYIFHPCKENLNGSHNFAQLQSQLSRNEGNNFPGSENPSYGGQVPSISYNSSNMDKPSPGPFGVLPHETVMPRMTRFERSTENFLLPVSKTAAASYNNGPYTEHDNVYSSAPLSVQSAYSGDTASLSPAVNSVTSSNFSSPSDYYSSPKTNFGAYNSLQSPMPQSPSVAQHSYPSSPYTNIDPVNHISVPPCSPMNGGTYVNNINGVPSRNGQTSQHSPSSNAATNVLCYNTPQSQNMAHHGPQSVISKTPDYHSEYGVYAHDQNSPSSYSSVYPPMHPGQMPNGNSRLSPRAHSHLNSVPHEGRIRYGHVTSVPSATISSPNNYLQAKVNHENHYGSCSSSIPPGQSMHPPKYPPCSSSMNSRRNSVHSGPSSMISNNIPNDRQFVFPSTDMVDDKGALDLFNSHVDSGAHEQDSTNSMTNYLDNDLRLLGSETVTGRQLRTRVSDCNPSRSASLGNSNKNVVHQPVALNDQVNGDLSSVNSKYPYSSSLDQSNAANSTKTFPQKRSRRGRKRKAIVNSGNRWSGRTSSRKNSSAYGSTFSAPTKIINEMNGADCYIKSKLRSSSINPPPPANHSKTFQPKNDFKLSSEKKDNNEDFKNDRNREKEDKKIEFRGPLNPQQVIEEIISLIHHTLPIRRRTRNTNRRESPYQARYLHFVRFRQVDPDDPWPPYQAAEPKKERSPTPLPPTPPPPPPPPPPPKSSKKKHKHKHKHKSVIDFDPLKIKIKMDPDNPREWYCCSGTYDSPISVPDDSSEESVSSDVNFFISSLDIKQEVDSKDESNHENQTGNLSKVIDKKLSAKEKKLYNLYEFQDDLDNTNNSETLPAGKGREKSAVSIKSEEHQNMPKKCGRKPKHASMSQETDTNSKTRNLSNQASEVALSSSMVRIKQEVIEESDAPAPPTERFRSLRSRRIENVPLNLQPGPSIKQEPPDFSSENYDEDRDDDTGSDPMWTPSAKSAKAAENNFLGGQNPGRKRGPKSGRRRSTSYNPPPKKKRDKSLDSYSKKKRSKKIAFIRRDSSDDDIKVKKEETDQFLVAKADLLKKTPYLWKVDKKATMLQRFDLYDIYDQNNILLYQSSYTYAALNSISESKYVTADVRIKSHNIVQYLGPKLAGADPVTLSRIKKVEHPKKVPYKKENFDNLKDDFTVYIQSLLSQDVDSTFFLAIKKYNDEYFLVPIKNLESISERKKEKLLSSIWNGELRKCANTYPCVSILDSHAENSTCKACKINLANKLIRFSGQPYDGFTLESVESLLEVETEFKVCDKCSSSLSLYNRLHHFKYNLFIKCHSKASEVKAKHDNLKSHEDVLKMCLEDISWIEELFGEQVKMWQDVGEKS